MNGHLGRKFPLRYQLTTGVSITGPNKEGTSTLTPLILKWLRILRQGDKQ